MDFSSDLLKKLKVFLFFYIFLLTNAFFCDILEQYQVRPGGQAAKTPPFHGGNTGSIPVRVTKNKKTGAEAPVFLFFM